MTEKHACIYCGNTETSESDIIPDALTNARITNKNVCKTEHNNKFSDLFESEVIEALALITNELDIKSHKGENYAAYPAKELLKSYIPAQDDEITIMTLHKSKGLEFNIVFHMDMYKYIISDEWGDEEQIKQLLNLHYVGVTRAIDACYIMIGTKRYRAKKNDFYKAEPSSFLDIKGLSERRNDVCWK